MSTNNLLSRLCLFALVSIQSLAYSFTNKYLPLPASVAGQHVHYLRVKQIPKWSCGYNALYNACCIEDYIGLPNSNTELTSFSAVCLPYIQAHGHGPMQGSSNKTLEKLAPKLGLQQLACLHMRNNTIESLIPVWYRFSYSDSPERQTQIIEHTKQTKYQNYINKLVKDFEQAQQPCCVHFICNISTARGRHWVLVSVVKDRDGNKALYICDNMNSPITEHSQMKQYISYLYKLFSTGNTAAPNQPDIQHIQKPSEHVTYTTQPTEKAKKLKKQKRSRKSLKHGVSKAKKARICKLLLGYKLYKQKQR